VSTSHDEMEIRTRADCERLAWRGTQQADEHQRHHEDVEPVREPQRPLEHDHVDRPRQADQVTVTSGEGEPQGWSVLHTHDVDQSAERPP
jgi:hypothetical protein